MITPDSIHTELTKSRRSVMTFRDMSDDGLSIMCYGMSMTGNILILVNVLRAALEYDRDIPAEIGVKVGSGVLINADLFKRFIEQHQSSLDYLRVKHGREYTLFGKCACGVACPSSRTFLGPPVCQATVQKSLLLNELIIPDVASIIREKLIS